MVDRRGSRRGSAGNDVTELRGLDQLLDLSKALKDFDTELRKELHKEVRTAAKPLVAISRTAIAAQYPQEGGVSKTLKRGRIRTAVKTGKDPGVSVVFSGLTVKLIERYGKIRHPVFPDTKNKTRRQWRWVDQPVPKLKGLLENTIRDNAKVVTPAIAKAVENTAARVIGKVK